MLYSDTVKKAMKLAYRAHEGQLDKNSSPYIPSITSLLFATISSAPSVFFGELQL